LTVFTTLLLTGNVALSLRGGGGYAGNGEDRKTVREMNAPRHAIRTVNERRTNMEMSHFENRVIGHFLIVINQQGSKSLYSHKSKPVLYLKCWGSDYPYLQAVEEKKRWLPVPMDSKPAI
jgi:hypothetical protein